MSDSHEPGSKRMEKLPPTEPCACRDGMFPQAETNRRKLLVAAGSSLAGIPSLARSAAAATAGTPPGAVHYDVAADPTREQGRPVGVDGGYGTRSQFDTAMRLVASNANPYSSWSLTPLAATVGNLTPSGLHYERHHSGIPTIDPARHSLTVHGSVTTAKRFSMADIQRMPAVTRRHFIECSGNTNSEWVRPTAATVQQSHGLLSTSEWTGVRFSDLAKQVGLDPDAQWVLAEGADGAVMTRSIPMAKMMSDALLAYGQNGEAIRPEQGYPLRLLLPGYEGNTHIKWLRRLQASRTPFMTREETSKYTDLMPDGKAWQFVFAMDAKSVITFPSGEMRLPGAGYYDISGLAWSGRGRIAKVEVSTDAGRSWMAAALGGTPEPMCTVRFALPWMWDGQAAVLLSRSTDETGYVQPTRESLAAVRGTRIIITTASRLGRSAATGASAMCWLDDPRRLTITAVALAAVLLAAADVSSGAAPAMEPDFGRPIAPADLAGMSAIPPSGAGLPDGRGTATDGAKVYATQCVACHGDKLQGVKSVGGPALIGGRGTLATGDPRKTVESYWPYATTLFDYVKRAMPFSAPGSLSDDQVYAVVAYILVQGKIIGPSDVLDARTLPHVHMPNADGFVPDPRPPAPPDLRLAK